MTRPTEILLINPPVLAVDPYQAYAYADVAPYSLYQIATLLKQEGHRVRVIDMMDYMEGQYQTIISPSHRYGTFPCGDNEATHCTKDAYLYGRDCDWLGTQLRAAPVPDQVLVTCCVSFNFQPAFDVIQRCRQHFPRAKIRLGGFYASTFPEHAAQSGADEVYRGRWEEADRTLPDLDLCSSRPRNWFFRLVNGCKYRCSFCFNRSSSPMLTVEPRTAAREVLRLHEHYGIDDFCNWDPNVMLVPEALNVFLEEMANAPRRPGIRFDMGIAPHLLTEDLASSLFRAGTTAMTIPFESVDPAMMRRFRKPYGEAESKRAMDTCRAIGFDVSRFHCTFLLGIRDESLESVFRTYFSILDSGGKPTPFPLTPTPGTREYSLHERVLRGKGLDLLNGHLWPTLPEDQVRTYDLVLRVVSCLDVDSARQVARDLPAPAGECFESALERWRSGAVGAAPPRGGAGDGGGVSPPRGGAGGADASSWRPLFTVPTWLHALCQECRDLERCRQLTERREPDPRRCFVQNRAVDESDLRSLLSWLRLQEGIEGGEGLMAQERALGQHLAALSEEQGGSLEPSASWDGRGWSLYRYTYSFHDGRPERWEADRAALGRWLETLGGGLSAVGSKVLSITAPPMAQALLFGVDRGDGARGRTKIYYRLASGMGPRKSALVEALSGFAAGSKGLPPAERLFIVGFDFGAAGVRGIKYYYLFDELTDAELRRWCEPSGLYEALAGRLGRGKWREVILVARHGVEARETPPVLAQVNIHCLKNDIHLADVLAAGTDASSTTDFAPVVDLFSRFPVYLSSLTVGLASSEALTIYYRLRGPARPPLPPEPIDPTEAP